MKTILIIEDETSIRENTQEILETKGFQVFVPGNVQLLKQFKL